MVEIQPVTEPAKCLPIVALHEHTVKGIHCCEVSLRALSGWHSLRDTPPPQSSCPPPCVAHRIVKLPAARSLMDVSKVCFYCPKIKTVRNFLRLCWPRAEKCATSVRSCWQVVSAPLGCDRWCRWGLGAHTHMVSDIVNNLVHDGLGICVMMCL